MELSKVCEDKVTTTMRVITHLTILALSPGCGAHGLTLSLPPIIKRKRDSRGMRSC